MTIATPGTNTEVELSWIITDLHDGHLRHTSVHAGWGFTVRERQSSAVLTAHHKDGRGGVTDYNTVDQAKAAAVAAMHPSEAMVWLTQYVMTVGSVRTASWGPLYFAAVPTDDGQLRFGHRVDGDLSDRVLVLPNMYEVREVAEDVLIDHYGPLRPVVEVPLPETADSPAERLSVAFLDLIGHDAPDEETVQEALNLAGLELRAVPAVTPLGPTERLARALYATRGLRWTAAEVDELLRRAGLTLS